MIDGTEWSSTTTTPQEAIMESHFSAIAVAPTLVQGLPTYHRGRPNTAYLDRFGTRQRGGGRRRTGRRR